MENHEIIKAAAEVIERAAIAIPHASTTWDVSDKSLSRYVTVNIPCGEYDDEYGWDDNHSIKIRISDHDIPSYYGRADYDVGVGFCGADTDYFIRNAGTYDEADLEAEIVAFINRKHAAFVADL